MNIIQEHDIQQSNHFWQVQNATPSPYDQKGQKFDQINITKVCIIDRACISVWEHFNTPSDITCCLKEVDYEQAYQDSKEEVKLACIVSLQVSGFSSNKTH